MDMCSPTWPFSPEAFLLPPYPAPAALMSLDATRARAPGQVCAPSWLTSVACVYTVRPHTWPGCRHAHPLTPRNNLVRRTQAYPLPGDLCRGVGDAQGQASAVGAEGAPEEGGLPGSRGETGWFALGSQEAWTCPLSAAASGWLSPEGIGKVLRALQVEDVALSVGGAAGRRHSPCGIPLG